MAGYDKYAKSVLKKLNFRMGLKKYKALLIVIASTLAGGTGGFFIAESVPNEKLETKAEIAYGDEIVLNQPHTFLGDFSGYEFYYEDTKEWKNEEPTLPGSYQVRSLSTKATGGIAYSNVVSFKIAKKATKVEINKDSQVYGEYPKLSDLSIDLIKNSNHHLVGNPEYEKTLSEDKKTMTLSLKLDSIKIVDKNGSDVTEYYNLEAVSKELNIVSKTQSIKLTAETKTYDGVAFKKEDLSNDFLSLYGDNLEIINVSYYKEDGTLLDSPPINGGKYRIVVDDYKIMNGESDVTSLYSISSFETSYTILKQIVDEPAQDLTIFTYDGTDKEYTLGIIENAPYSVVNQNDLIKKNSGSYTVTIRLNNTDNYVWRSTNNSNDLVYSFVINKAKIDKPKVDSTVYTFTGEEQIYNIKEDDRYSITNNSRTVAGTQIVNVAIKNEYLDNYQWDDGTNTDLSYTFKINPKQIVIPLINKANIEFDSLEHTFISVPEKTSYTGDNPSQSAIGTYNITISLDDTSNYTWSDGTITNKEYSFSIKRKEVSIPQNDINWVNSKRVYTGSEQVYQIPESSDYSILVENSNKATNVGVYSFKLHLTNSNYIWKNGTSDDVTYNFEIVKAEVTKPTNGINPLTSSEYIYTYSGDEQSFTLKEDDLNTLYTREQTNKFINNDTYEIVYQLKDTANYKWEGTNDSSDYTLTLTVNKLFISDPTFDSAHLTYNKAEQYFTIYANNKTTKYIEFKLDNQVVEIEDLKATNHKESGYLLECKIKDTYNGHVSFESLNETVSYTYYIDKQKVAKPSIVGDSEFTYDYDFIKDEAIEYTFKYDEAEYYEPSDTSTLKASQANQDNETYKITLEIVDTNNYEYNDGTSSVTLEYKILKKVITVPNNKTIKKMWTGSVVSVEPSDIEGFDINFMSLSNNEATNVDTYEYNISLKDTMNTIWSAALPIYNFLISRNGVNRPVAKTTPYVYTGSPINYFNTSDLVSNYTNYYIVSNNTKTEANEDGYTVTVSLNENYFWIDTETDEDLEFTFIINRAKVNYPTLLNDEITYNGNKVKLDIVDESSTKAYYDVIDNEKYTNCNYDSVNLAYLPYQITFKLNNVNYTWKNGETTNYTIDYYIKPIDLTITSKSLEKTYDGTPLYTNEFEVVGSLVSGHQIVVTNENTIKITNVGEKANALTYKVVDTNDGNQDVSYNYSYTNTQINGTLKVKPKSITLYPYDSEVTYTYGDANPKSLLTYNLVGGSKITIESVKYIDKNSYELDSATNAGTYTVKIIENGFTTDKFVDGDSASNYTFEYKTRELTILRKEVTEPTKVETTYTGLSQTLLTGFDSNVMVLSSSSVQNINQVNANTYIYKIDLVSANYKWKNNADDLETTITSIIKTKEVIVGLDSITESLIYTGSELSISPTVTQDLTKRTIDGHNVVVDKYTISGKGTTILHAGSYTITLDNASSVKVLDGSNADQSSNYSISFSTDHQNFTVAQREITFSIDSATNKTYDGENYLNSAITYSYVSTDYNITYKDPIISYRKNGTQTATSSIIDAGIYDAKITGITITNENASDYKALFEENYHESLITISPKEVTVPTQSTTFTYKKGVSQTLFTVKDTDLYTIVNTDDVSKENAGTYPIVLRLKDTNHIWKVISSLDQTESLSSLDQTIKVTINKQEVTLPTQNSVITYNGLPHNLFVEMVDKGSHTFGEIAKGLYDITSSDDNSKIYAGKYTVSFTLADSNNYKWASTCSKGQVEVTISKANLTIKPYDFVDGDLDLDHNAVVFGDTAFAYPDVTKFDVVSGTIAAIDLNKIKLAISYTKEDNTAWSINKTDYKPGTYYIKGSLTADSTKDTEVQNLKDINDNYNVTINNGTLVIKKRAITIVLKDLESYTYPTGTSKYESIKYDATSDATDALKYYGDNMSILNDTITISVYYMDSNNKVIDRPTAVGNYKYALEKTATKLSSSNTLDDYYTVTCAVKEYEIKTVGVNSPSLKDENNASAEILKSYVYDKDTAHKIIVNNPSSYYEVSMAKTTSGTDYTSVGTYTITLKLKNTKENNDMYYWNSVDESIWTKTDSTNNKSDLVFTYEITKRPVSLPSIISPQKSEFTYDGTEKTFEYTNSSDSAFYEVDSKSSTLKATNANEDGYYIVFKLKDNDNYKWNATALSNNTIRLKYVINKATINLPFENENIQSHVYDGEEHTYSFNTGLGDFDKSQYTIKIDGVKQNSFPTISSTNVVKNVITVSINGDNCKWENNVSGTTVSAIFEITRKPIAKPTTSTTSFLYYGNEVDFGAKLEINTTQIDIDSNSDSKKTNVGEYTIKYAPNSNHMWNDETTDTVSMDWEITPILVNKPTVTDANSKLLYNGSSKDILSIIDGEWSKINAVGATVRKDVGEYTITLTPIANHAWYENPINTTSYEIKWYITPILVDRPSSYDTSFECTKDVIDYSKIFGYTDDEYAMIEFSGNVSATNVGNYQITLKPIDNHAWSNDNGTDTVSIDWKITPILIDKPTVTDSNSKFLYESGTTRNIVTELGIDTDMITVTGETDGENVGEYVITLTPKTDYYAWNENPVNTTSYEIKWYITPILVDRPSSYVTSFVYCKEEIDYSKKFGYDDAEYAMIEFGGNVSATNVGNYQITLTPKANHAWKNDDGTDTITIDWKITILYVPKPTVSTQTEVQYNGSSQAETFQFIINKDYEKYMITSSYKLNDGDATLITFVEDTNDKTIKYGRIINPAEPYDSGTYTVTISLGGDANVLWANSNNNNDIVKDYTIIPRTVTCPTCVNQEVTLQLELVEDDTNGDYYDIKPVKPTFTDSADSDYYTVSFNDSPYSTTNTVNKAKTYQLIVTLTDKVNTKWSNDSYNKNEYKMIFDFIVKPCLIEIPTGYNGDKKSEKINFLNPDIYESQDQKNKIKIINDLNGKYLNVSGTYENISSSGDYNYYITTCQSHVLFTDKSNQATISNNVSGTVIELTFDKIQQEPNYYATTDELKSCIKCISNPDALNYIDIDSYGINYNYTNEEYYYYLNLTYSGGSDSYLSSNEGEIIIENTYTDKSAYIISVSPYSTNRFMVEYTSDKDNPNTTTEFNNCSPIDEIVYMNRTANDITQTVQDFVGLGSYTIKEIILREPHGNTITGDYNIAIYYNNEYYWNDEIDDLTITFDDYITINKPYINTNPEKENNIYPYSFENGNTSFNFEVVVQNNEYLLENYARVCNSYGSTIGCNGNQYIFRQDYSSNEVRVYLNNPYITKWAIEDANHTEYVSYYLNIEPNKIPIPSTFVDSGNNNKCVYDYLNGTGIHVYPAYKVAESTYNKYSSYLLSLMEVNGTTEAWKAGTYSVTYVPKAGYEWDLTGYDGEYTSTQPITLTWTINKVSIPIPGEQNYTYDGAYHEYKLNNNTYSYEYKVRISGDTGSFANVGEYTIYIRPEDNYKWANSTPDNENFEYAITWRINPITIVKPEASTYTYQYTGNSINIINKLSSTNFASMYSNGKITATEKYEMTSAGTYVLNLKPVQNYAWVGEMYPTTYSITWKITPIEIDKPTLTNLSVSYNGSPINFINMLDIGNFLSQYTAGNITDNGNGTKTDAGTYSLTLTPKANYVWEGEDEPTTLTITCKINPLEIAKPSTDDKNYTYKGTQISVIDDYLPINVKTAINNGTLAVTGTSFATNVGQYTITLTPTKNYVWEEDTEIKPLSIKWNINPVIIEKPIPSKTTFEYNGSPVNFLDGLGPYINGKIPSLVTASGTSTATDAGEYKLTLTPIDNYVWEGDTNSKPYSITWEITKVSIDKPTINKTTFTYNGSEVDFDELIVKDNQVSFAGDTKKTTPGNYSFTVSLKDPTNYEWSDESGSASYSVSWKILSNEIDRPSLTTSWEYSRSEVSYTDTLSSYGDKIVVTGQISGTNIGSYQMYIKPAANYAWSDGTPNETITVNWTITQRQISIQYIASSSPVYDGTVKTIDNSDVQIVSGSLLTGDTYTFVASSEMDYNLTFSSAFAGNHKIYIRDVVIRDSLNNDVTSNYNIKTIKGTFTIQKKPLTIYGEGKTYDYTGSEIVYDGNITYDGLIAGDTIDTTLYERISFYSPGTYSKSFNKSTSVFSSTNLGLYNSDDVGNCYAITYVWNDVVVKPINQKVYISVLVEENMLYTSKKLYASEGRCSMSGLSSAFTLDSVVVSGMYGSTINVTDIYVLDSNGSKKQLSTIVGSENIEEPQYFIYTPVEENQ